MGNGFQSGEVRILVLPVAPGNNASNRIDDVSPMIETANEVSRLGIESHGTKA